MIDPISLAVGAGITLSGVLTGRMVRRKPSVPALSSVPTCGCSHPMALHDRDTDRCHGQICRTHYYKNGDRNGFEWVPCTCRRYLGPHHIADVWAPGMPLTTMKEDGQ